METNNETVEQIHDELKRDPLAPNGAKPWTHYLAERILVAHNREIAERDGEHKGLLKANESLAANNDRLRDELKKKDAEIAELRECLREAVEWSCGNPDENCGDCVAHGGDTPCKCERWRKALEGGTVVEIASLRSLVKELADALKIASPMVNRDSCSDCAIGKECNKRAFPRPCLAQVRFNALVAKAREVCK